MMITIAQYLILRLKELNCQTVFGIPGTSCSDFYDEVYRSKGIEAIITASELEAGYSADGYARYRGLGACAVAYGVGTLSLINAIAGSLVEKVPVIVINGGPTDDDIKLQSEKGILFSHSTGRSDTDLKVFSQVCLKSYKVDVKSNDVAEQIDALFRVAVTSYGPVYLEVPEDHWNTECLESPTVPILKAPNNEVKIPSEFVKEAMEKAASASDPVFLLGVELLRNGLSRQTLEMIEATGIPFATTVLSKSFLSEDHPLYLGTYDTNLVEKPVRKTMEESDCLIALGCVYGIDLGKLIGKQYDSMIHLRMDEARIGKKTYPSISLRQFLHQFRPEFRSLPNAKDRNLSIGFTHDVDEKRLLTHDILFAIVDRYLEESRTKFQTILDTCMGSFSGADLKMKFQDVYAANAVWLSIGHGTPAGNGVYFATGNRPIIITGDGGFQMVVQSVSTMAKYKIPAILIIIDNANYAIEQFLIDSCYFTKEPYQPLPYVGLQKWNYEKMPELFAGGRGFKVRTSSDLLNALVTAQRNLDGPTVISVQVPSTDIPSTSKPYAVRKCKEQK